jgi:hypothetical protein
MRVRGKEAKGYRMTSNRLKLIEMGYSIEQIISQNLNLTNYVNFEPINLENKTGMIVPEQQENSLSDDEIIENQIKYFQSMEKTALGVALGDAKAMIISGSAGIGKSHGIEQILSNLKDSESNHEWVTGHCTATGLYQTLYNFRFEGCTIIFDDSDKIFYDETSLGILKHALDTKKTRRISWKSKTELRDENGEVIPTSFDFEGSIIFISNINLSGIVSQNNKLSPHIEAIISRILYYDMHKIFMSPRDYMLRISYLKDSIFKEQNIDNDGQELIMNFFNGNAKTMRELSLRVLTKLCQVYKIHGKETFEFNAAIATMK